MSDIKPGQMVKVVITDKEVEAPFIKYDEFSGRPTVEYDGFPQVCDFPTKKAAKKKTTKKAA